MHQFSKTAGVVAAAGLLVGLAVVGARVDRSPAARSSVAKGVDLSRIRMMDAPVMACFNMDEPIPARHAAAIEAMFMDSMLRYNDFSSWTGTGQGIALSWSFVPDGLTIPSGVGEPSGPSNLFATLDGQFVGDRALWIQRFEESFQRWEDITGNTYTRVTDGVNDWDDGSGWGASGNDTTRGDIRIAMKPIGPGTLAYNSFPTNSDMVIDSDDGWRDGFEDRRLRNVIMHEHGHGLGYGHICPQAGRSIMEPAINTGFDGLQHDEFRGGQRGYGDPNEPDNSRGSATDLGTILLGETVTIGDLPDQPVATAPQPVFTSNLSIDSNGEQDYFEFTLAEGSLVDIHITPIGWRYDDSDQGQNCGSGNIIDSDEIADLAFEIEDAGGSTIAVFDAEPLGATEQATALMLPDAGVYYLRVYETNSPPGSQLYEGAISVTDTVECMSAAACDDGDPCTTDTCDNGLCSNTAVDDCNANGRDDACEIAQGDTDDCNMNGLPDSCDIDSSPFVESSPQLTPIGDGSPQSYTFVAAPDAAGDVTLAFDGLADFNSPLENFEVFLNGVLVGEVYEEPSGTFFDCTVGNDTLVVSDADWNNAVSSGGGDVIVDIVTSSSVNAGACSPGATNYVRVEANYNITPLEEDVNANGVPDSCEVLTSCAFADITADGVCTPGTGDNAITLSDFSCYLSEWSAGSAFADITTAGMCAPGAGGDGVDLSDFSCYLSEWSAGCP